MTTNQTYITITNESISKGQTNIKNRVIANENVHFIVIEMFCAFQRSLVDHVNLVTTAEKR